MSNKQVIFLQAMLESSTITKAAEKAGITRQTAYRFLKDTEFQAELKRRRDECINDTVRYLQGKLAMCSETLIKIIENPATNDQVKINAINAVYATCKSMTEIAEVVARLEEIEKAIESGANDES